MSLGNMIDIDQLITNNHGDEKIVRFWNVKWVGEVWL